jgi:dynein heavy chain
MFSGENEFIKSSYAVDPKDKKVEDWMGEVENMMFDTIRDVLKFSVDDYLERGRNDWIMTHAGQCVLNGSQVHWTQDLENKLAKDGKQGVKDYFEFCETQLLETVSLVRQKLTKLQSLTLNALIVIDVHARDVIGRLIQHEVEDKNHF